jgi:hypothetical protein
MGVSPSQPKYLRDTKTRRFYIPLEVQSQAMWRLHQIQEFE